LRGPDDKVEKPGHRLTVDRVMDNCPNIVTMTSTGVSSGLTVACATATHTTIRPIPMLTFIDSRRYSRVFHHGYTPLAHRTASQEVSNVARMRVTTRLNPRGDWSALHHWRYPESQRPPRRHCFREANVGGLLLSWCDTFDLTVLGTTWPRPCIDEWMFSTAGETRTLRWQRRRDRHRFGCFQRAIQTQSNTINTECSATIAVGSRRKSKAGFRSFPGVIQDRNSACGAAICLADYSDRVPILYTLSCRRGGAWEWPVVRFG